MVGDVVGGNKRPILRQIAPGGAMRDPQEDVWLSSAGYAAPSFMDLKLRFCHDGISWCRPSDRMRSQGFAASLLVQPT